jgi:hypothetical protein
VFYLTNLCAKGEGVALDLSWRSSFIQFQSSQGPFRRSLSRLCR